MEYLQHAAICQLLRVHFISFPELYCKTVTKRLMEFAKPWQLWVHLCVVNSFQSLSLGSFVCVRLSEVPKHLHVKHPQNCI